MSTTRALLPRESGAYAELAFPLLTGFLAGGVSPPAVGFAVAVVAWFLAREPLAVLNGVRGKRLEASLRTPARRAAFVLGGLGAVGAAVALVLAPPPARLWAGVPGAFGVALAPALLRGHPKRLGGEILVAFGLATMILPIGLAGRMPLRVALAASAVWASCFILATLAVHAIKARHKPGLGPTWTILATPIAAPLVVGGGLFGTLTGRLPVSVGIALLPPALVVVATAVLRTHPRRLKRVGWSLVAANTVTLLLLLWG